jgi:peptidoglycan hydrolase CwlO-like protein
MKFQILNILVYGANGQIRSIELKPDAVNVVTGQSKTGKSALIHIVDYCLGRRECNVPAGVIRKHVEWYAVKLQTSSGEVFIARRNPEPGKESSEDIYIERGTSLSFPEASSLTKNANLETLASILNQVLGIGEYTHEPKAGQTRKTGTADIGKALFYCFQEQSEIDDQKFLFHRQGEPFIPQSIKDYLPYFLGAITDEFIQNKEELRKLNRKLKQVESRIAERNRLKGQNFERAFALLNEAKSVDLIAADEPLQDSWSNVRQLIEAALARNIDNDPAEPNVDVLNDLLDRQQRIRETYRIATSELKSLKDLKRSSNGFGSEMGEQKSRLESINIFGHTGDPNTCPLCSSTLPSAVPSAEAIRASLTDIDSQLEAVTNDTPHLDAMIAKAEDQLGEIKKQLDEVKASIISLQTTNQRISDLRDFNSRRAMIKGRLSLYLENMPANDVDDSDDKLEAEKIAEQVRALEAVLDDETLAGRLESILSLVSAQITSLARKLEIEHSDSPMRLDLKKLTIVADHADDGPIPMPKMGSGETWVGLHLVTHLALHNWFFKKQRPVPQFLFLDQPSQAYFPPDTSAETVREQTEATNPDRQSVIRMFKLIVEETKNFQVIVTEHADIREDWYQALVRENWWDGKQKLVPVEWIEVES